MIPTLHRFATSYVFQASTVTTNPSHPIVLPFTRHDFSTTNPHRRPRPILSARLQFSSTRFDPQHKPQRLSKSIGASRFVSNQPPHHTSHSRHHPSLLRIRASFVQTTVHMTSTQSQSATTPAQNTTAAPSAPSYASAAGATKKPASTPLVVTGADPSSVAGSSVASSQNASSSVNGRQSIPPAVPTIANGASSQNGESSDHNRNGSVSITAPGNGYANTAPGIQFGFEKTPQPSAAVPIPAGQVPTPAQSPAPIPRPSASGGKPGATESQFKIGSFPNDGDVSSDASGLRRTLLPD